MKWSIQITYQAYDDNKTFTARSVFWCEANDIEEAYNIANNSDWGGRKVKLGAIIPGWHEKF